MCWTAVPGVRLVWGLLSVLHSLTSMAAEGNLLPFLAEPWIALGAVGRFVCQAFWSGSPHRHLLYCGALQRGLASSQVSVELLLSCPPLGLQCRLCTSPLPTWEGIRKVKLLPWPLLLGMKGSGVNVPCAQTSRQAGIYLLGRLPPACGLQA